MNYKRDVNSNNSSEIATWCDFEQFQIEQQRNVISSNFNEVATPCDFEFCQMSTPLFSVIKSNEQVLTDSQITWKCIQFQIT